jgi:hypothetical protein
LCQLKLECSLRRLARTAAELLATTMDIKETMRHRLASKSLVFALSELGLRRPRRFCAPTVSKRWGKLILFQPVRIRSVHRRCVNGAPLTRMKRTSRRFHPKGHQNSDAEKIPALRQRDTVE